jgi:sugar phosphate isomerase/epimerase
VSREDAVQRKSQPNDTVLCSGTLGNLSFADKIEAASAAGFAGISVYYRESNDPGKVRRAVADAGLFFAELDGPVTWLPNWDGPTAPSAAEVVDRAAALGARSFTVLEITGATPPLDIAVEAFGAVCDLAAQAGVLVHIEPFPWSGISDFGFAADIVAGADRSNGGILLDTWHLFRGPNRGALPSRVKPEMVLGLQINDLRATPDNNVPYEAMHDRLLPGSGAAAAEIRTLLDDLRAGGCSAPLGVEVFSDEFAALPPLEVAQRAFEALQYVAPYADTDEFSRRRSSSLRPRQRRERESQ